MSLNLETMRTNIKILLVGFLMSTAFTSCKTASSLSEAKVFQKRKYTKGFQVNFRKANPKAETKSVTVLAFEELDRDKQITSVDSKEVKTVKISPEERTLITASSEGNSKKSASDKVNAGSVKWTKNIALPVLISEIFSKPPEDFVEQPMPAGAIIGNSFGNSGHHSLWCCHWKNKPQSRHERKGFGYSGNRYRSHCHFWCSDCYFQHVGNYLPFILKILYFRA
jgi:hypothetical protein